MSERTPPTLATKRFLRRLSRLRGRRRTAFVQVAVAEFIAALADYRHNHSDPVEDFDPTHEYGWGVEYWSADPRVRAANLLRALAEATVTLPPGTPVELRSAVPADFGRGKMACYYRPPDMPAGAIQLPIDWRGDYNVAAGVLDHAIVETPR